MNIIKQYLFSVFGQNYTKIALKKTDALTYCYSIIHPYQYDSSRYPNSFLEASPEFSYTEDIKKYVERVIYIFWTGDNEITPNRLAGIQSMEEKCGVPIKLITPQNLPKYILDSDPIPEAYQYLSLNHRSDYLRSYFMYHYGGGYADIKTYHHSWINAFDQLDASENAYVIGYPEVGFNGAANQDLPEGNLKTDLHYHWRYLIGNGAFICRPHTKMTAEWHTVVKNRLLDYSEQLKAHPAKDVFGKNKDYPIAWSGMQGGIFHPFCLKYKERVIKNKVLMPSFRNYK